MKDISDAPDLIMTARDALTRDLLPLLSKDARYLGLMIANAMAIAAREMQSAAGVERDEAVRLRTLLATASDWAVGGDDTARTRAALPLLRRALRDAIRAGRFDGGDASAALSAHLELTASAWLAISNPKALRTIGAAS